MTTKVYTYFINKTLKSYMEEHTELGCLGLGKLPPVDKYLVESISFDKFNIKEEELVGLENYFVQVF